MVFEKKHLKKNFSSSSASNPTPSSAVPPTSMTYSQALPYLQLKQKEGAASFYSAIKGLQSTLGNQGVQSLLQQINSSPSELNLQERDDSAAPGTAAPTEETPAPAPTNSPTPTPVPAPDPRQLQNLRNLISNPGAVPWNQLPEEAKTNLQTLGWNENKWNGNNPPSNWNVLWGQLDPSEKMGPSEGPNQKAARALGFTPQSWNERVRPGEFPPSCAGFVGQVAFYDERDKVREDWTGDAMGDQGYYIGYGKKYVQKFTGPFIGGLYSTGADRYAFIRWAELTRDLLQIAIVSNLVNPYTDTYQHIYDVAFDSHPAAYVGGGLGDLAMRAVSGAIEEAAIFVLLDIASGNVTTAVMQTALDSYNNRHGRLGPLIDLMRIMFTVEMKDLMKPESFRQIVETIRLLLVQAAQAVWNSIFDPILNPFRDDQARETVRDLASRGLLSAVPLDKKQLLIEYMIRGFTGDDDEQTILQVLSSNPSHIKPIVLGVGYERICENFHGEEWTSLRSLLLQAVYPILSQDERTDCIFQLMDGGTPERKEEEIIRLLYSNPGHMVYAVNRLQYPTFMDELTGAELEAFCNMTGSYLYPLWSFSSKVSAIQWLVDGRTPTWAEEEIIKILQSMSNSEFRTVVNQIGRRTFNWNLTGSRQDAFDRMYDQLG